MTVILRIIFLLALVLSVGHGQYSMAADGASFNPIPITVTSQGTYPVGAVIQWPSTSFPPDAGRWLECNGQAVPSGSQYDRLRAIIGATVPNYNDQFLRGTTTASQVGTKVSDSIRSHTIYIPGQNAPVSGNLNSTGLSGNLNSTSISGSASSQSYSYQAANGSDTVLTWADGAPNFGQTQVEHMGWSSGSTSGGSISGSLNSGGLSGSLYSGALTGTAYVANQTGSYTGGSETAPVHTKVRYLIRAVQ